MHYSQHVGVKFWTEIRQLTIFFLKKRKYYYNAYDVDTSQLATVTTSPACFRLEPVTVYRIESFQRASLLPSGGKPNHHPSSLPLSLVLTQSDANIGQVCIYNIHVLGLPRELIFIKGKQLLSLCVDSKYNTVLRLFIYVLHWRFVDFTVCLADIGGNRLRNNFQWPRLEYVPELNLTAVPLFQSVLHTVEVGWWEILPPFETMRSVYAKPVR